MKKQDKTGSAPAWKGRPKRPGRREGAVQRKGPGRPGKRREEEFVPHEDHLRTIHAEFKGRSPGWEEVANRFDLATRPVDPGEQKAQDHRRRMVFVALDVCGVRLEAEPGPDLPEIAVAEPGKRANEEPGFFIDQYIREISVYPTLSREQESELAKWMDVCLVRYRSAMALCPPVLDWIEGEVQAIDGQDSGGHGFGLARFKGLAIPGDSKLDYPRLWKSFRHTWEQVRRLRGRLDAAGGEGLETDILRFNIAFLVKDLCIREGQFFKQEELLKEKVGKVARWRSEFGAVHESHERYIECKNLLVNYNLKLVLSIARKFFRGQVPPMDIIQYGNQGLIRAAEDFNYRLEYKFSTYAIWWIRQKIQEGIQEQERMIRIPAYKLNMSRRHSSLRDRLAHDVSLSGQDEPETAAMEEELDARPEPGHIPQAFVMAPQSDDQEDAASLDQIMDPRGAEEETRFDTDARSKLHTHLQAQYTKRERFILTMRYGLQCDGITPVGTTMEDLVCSYEEIIRRHEREEIELTARILDAELPPVAFEFQGLPTEVRVSREDWVRLKDGRRVPRRSLARILPHDQAEMDAALARKDSGAGLSGREAALLALATGRDFDAHIQLKPKDRLVLSNVWMRKEVPASVAKRIVMGEGLILESVAQIFDLTKERVRQIEAKIMRNIGLHLALP